MSLPKISVNNKHLAYLGENFSKVFIITFFIAVLNSLIFYITFTIKDKDKEIQQPSVLIQLILSIFLSIIFGCMGYLEKNYPWNRCIYFSLAALNLLNFMFLILFYEYNKKNNENDTDNKKKRAFFWCSYVIYLFIFGLSVFVCARVFKDFIQC